MSNPAEQLSLVNYEQAAQYVYDEIGRAGFSSPRVIQRLVAQLYELTRYGVRVEQALERERERGR